MNSPIQLIKTDQGFSLTELMIAVAILGILGAVALPQYFNQVQKTRQNEAAATVSQIQTTIAAFVDEMRLLPTSWNDLGKSPRWHAGQDQSNFLTSTSPVRVARKASKTAATKLMIESDQIFMIAVPKPWMLRRTTWWHAWMHRRHRSQKKTAKSSKC